MASFVNRLLRNRPLDQISSTAFAFSSSRCLFSSSASSEPIRATLFPGDGIGPEIANSVKQIWWLSLAWPGHGCGLLSPTGQFLFIACLMDFALVQEQTFALLASKDAFFVLWLAAIFFIFSVTGLD
ncbi:hypothetical protein ACLOJK_023746 [Asimina triloba]